MIRRQIDMIHTLYMAQLTEIFANSFVLNEGSLLVIGNYVAGVYFSWPELSASAGNLRGRSFSNDIGLILRKADKVCGLPVAVTS